MVDPWPALFALIVMLQPRLVCFCVLFGLDIQGLQAFVQADPSRCKHAPLLHRGSSHVYEHSGKQDDIVTRWEFTSTSTEGDVGRKFARGRTYQQIQDGCGVDLQDVSVFGKAEAEVLLLPGAQVCTGQLARCSSAPLRGPRVCCGCMF